MTTATEHHDAQLAAIKARHEEVRAMLKNPNVREVDVPPGMRWDQMGLNAVMVDEIGRLWAITTSSLKMVFDPHALGRPGMLWTLERSRGESDHHEGLVAALGGESSQPQKVAV